MNQVQEEANGEKTATPESISLNYEQSSNQICIETRSESRVEINNVKIENVKQRVEIHQNVEVHKENENKLKDGNSHESSKNKVDAKAEIKKTENSLKVSKEISKKEIKKSVSASSSKEIEKELKKTGSISQESIKTDSKHFQATSSLFQVKEMEAKKSVTIIKEKGKVELTFGKNTSTNVLNSKIHQTTSANKSTSLSNSKEKEKILKETSKNVKDTTTKSNPVTKSKETKTEPIATQVMSAHEPGEKFNECDAKQTAENTLSKSELQKESKKSASNSKEINKKLESKQENLETVQSSETRKVSDEIKKSNEKLEKVVKEILVEQQANSIDQNAALNINETVKENHEQFVEHPPQAPASKSEEQANKELNDGNQANKEQIQEAKSDSAKHQVINDSHILRNDVTPNHVEPVVIPNGSATRRIRNKHELAHDFGFNEDQIGIFEEAFQIFDKDRDGYITLDEIRTVMNSLGFFPGDDIIRKSIQRVDYDNSGTVDFEEFISMMSKFRQINSAKEMEDELMEIFKIFDKNQDGFIDNVELKDVLIRLGENITDEEVNEMIREADTNGDHKVSFNEFRSILYDKTR